MCRKASRFCMLLGLLTGLIATPVFGQWFVSIPKNAVTGEQNIHAHSPITVAMKQMSFPYDDITAWLGVGCDSQEEWIYFGFSKAPYLLDTSTDLGYHRISTQVKWDDQVEQVILKQKWYSSLVHFSNDREAISRATTSRTVQLELKWHGQGKTYFQFSLDGASAALDEIRWACAGL